MHKRFVCANNIQISKIFDSIFSKIKHNCRYYCVCVIEFSEKIEVREILNDNLCFSLKILTSKYLVIATDICLV